MASFLNKILILSIFYLLNLNGMELAQSLMQEDINKANEELSALKGSTRFFKAHEFAKEITTKYHKNFRTTAHQHIRPDQTEKDLHPAIAIEEREDFLEIMKAYDLLDDARLILLEKDGFSVPVVQYNYEKYIQFLGLRNKVRKKEMDSIEQLYTNQASEKINQAFEQSQKDKNIYKRVCGHLLVWSVIGWGFVAYQNYFAAIVQQK